MIEFDAAQEIISASVEIGQWGMEDVSIEDALYEVVAEKIFVDRDYPPFNRSAMDGIAVRSSDVKNGISTFKVVDTLTAGKDNQSIITPNKGEGIKIMTGADTPSYLDQVIKVEEIIFNGEYAELKNVTPQEWSNIAIKGEDFKGGQEIISPGTFITPDVINLLSVIGVHTISVYRKPSFSIICTGDELVSVSETPKPFQIRNSNAYALKSLLDKYAFSINKIVLVEDDVSNISTSISEAVVESDIVLLTGGVSMGDKDFVPELLAQKGIKQLFHKIAVKPGKPLWFGKNDYTYVFGLPGNPLSTQFSFLTSVANLIRSALNLNFTNIELPLYSDVKRKGRFNQFIPASVLINKGTVMLSPKSINGSGDISSTLFTDGMIKLSNDKTEFDKGSLVDFYSWNYIESGL